MRLFKSLEALLFTGEQIKDYGVISDEYHGPARTQTSLLLCRQHGKYIIVLRHKSTAAFAFDLKYTTLSLSCFSKFKEIETDILARMAKEE